VVCLLKHHVLITFIFPPSLPPSLDPLSKAAFNNLGVALQETGNFAPALQAYKKALDIDGLYAPALQNLAALTVSQVRLIPPPSLPPSTLHFLKPTRNLPISMDSTRLLCRTSPRLPSVRYVPQPFLPPSIPRFLFPLQVMTLTPFSFFSLLSPTGSISARSRLYSTRSLAFA